MSKTMLYRLSGDPERGTGESKILGVPVQYKAFADDEIEAARGRGWVKHAEIVDAKASVDAESTEQGDSSADKQSSSETASGDTGAENTGGEQSASDSAASTESAPTFPTDSKANLVAWIREQGLAEQFDLRKSLADLTADVTAHMSAANG